MPDPSLDLNHLLRLQALTRDYGRLTQSGAGLGKALGGGFLLAMAAVEAGGHGRLSLLGGLAPLPLGPVLALALLPFLWLAGREALARWWYQKHGVVAPVAEPAPRRLWLARGLLPVLMLLCLVPVRWQPQAGLRAALVLALALALVLAWPRLLRRGRLERLLGVLLFFGPCLLIAGIQMAAADTLLAFPLVGSAALVVGVREHLAYRRVAAALAERP